MRALPSSSSSKDTAIDNPKGDQILRELDALKSPLFDIYRADEPSYMAGFLKEANAYERKRQTLIWRLYRADPRNSKLAALLQERWTRYIPPKDELPGSGRALVEKEIELVLAHHVFAPMTEACDYCMALLTTTAVPFSVQAVDVAWQAFLAKYPSSPQTPLLLFICSSYLPQNDQLALWRLIVATFPNFESTPMIRGALSKLNAIGTPFNLTFTDAVSGRSVDVATMRGKVVVVYFWASWCSSCAASRPGMMDIYGRYHDKGVEFISVSLDHSESEGGLASLLEYVRRKHIPWPVYYQGGNPDSFSASWGVMSIPQIFVVDKQGNFQGSTSPESPNFIQSFGATLDKYLSKS